MFNPNKPIPMMSSSMRRLDLRVGPSDDHRYSSSHAAIAAESSQHNLNLLVSDSSVTTTTVVTARNINVHIVAFLEMVNRVEASTNIWRRRAHSRHLISLYRSTGARPSWGDDNERDDESCLIGQRREAALLLWHKAQPVFHLLDMFPEQALKRNQMLFQQGKPPEFHHQMILMTTILMETQKQLIMKILQTLSALGAEHSTLLGRLGDMNQKYDAAAVDNRVLRADIETREQKYILLRLIKETVKRVNPLQWARPNMGIPVNNTPRIPSTTGTGLSPNQSKGLQNQFATNPKNMYETIGITSINHKIESSTLWFLKLLSCSSFIIYCANPQWC
ncbi:hypothetical protein HID58_037675 [Brassica napus]|uniref:Uncharacterized protein n=1 Tax=Brassica napus TaxID=3708 RepID=A0ABQ8BM26_BRANA|nr:hypothetical protein HID58_037675 [Brassica napus]